MQALPVAVRAGLVALVGAALVAPLSWLPASTATAVAGAMHLVALVVALVAMVRSARRGDVVGARSRWCLAAALLAVAAGSLIGLALTILTGSIPVPSVADPVSLAWVPFAIYGFWKVPKREGAGAGGALQLMADIAVALTALLYASYLWILQPLANTGRWTPTGRAVELSYPLLDVTVAAMVLSLLPRARADMRAFLNVVACGLILIVVSDSGSVLLLAERGVASFGWPDVTLQAGMMLLAYAARMRSRTRLNERRASSVLDRNLPYLPIAVAGSLGLLHVALVGPLDLWQALMGAAMLVAIVWRQSLYASALAGTAEAHRSAAVTDALTGLANRKAFISRLTEHLSTPGVGPAAVVLFDLDGFKEVNDTLGHDAGDEVLIAFAAALTSAAGGGLAARLGGDEFALLVVADGDPVSMAADVATQVNARSFSRVHGGPRGIRGSAGVAALLAGDTPSEAMRRADLAMYAAKQSGRSGVQVFTPSLAAKADRRSLLVAALPGAAARGELHLVYQPLFRLNDGQLTGAEVLLRWDHPLLGAVGPDEFIPIAEDAGHIGGLGAWVREQSLAQVAAWDRAGLQLPRLFVNVAAAEFVPELPQHVAALLAGHRLLPDRLALEITESRLPGEAALPIMASLRSSGVHLALDDFGTGYSSLSQLAHLPVDILKIDRDFIGNLGEQSGRPMLDAIISLGRALGLTTVAEGVEHLAQAAEAANAGLDYAQGYLFSRPLPPAELAELLGSARPLPTLPVPRTEVRTTVLHSAED
ncbi:MAG: putative bifunctional diguanylate cyclase/phosphodiesterase [Mycobacteriales bacterium]